MMPDIQAQILGQRAQPQRLGLSQIEGFTAPKELTIHGQVWELIRESGSHLSATPALQYMRWLFADNLELNLFDPRVYWYCMHGIKEPSSQGDKPVRLLFQWFHTVRVPLNPANISPADWDKANVYASSVGDFETEFCRAMLGGDASPPPAQTEWPEIIRVRPREIPTPDESAGTPVKSRVYENPTKNCTVEIPTEKNRH